MLNSEGTGIDVYNGASASIVGGSVESIRSHGIYVGRDDSTTSRSAASPSPTAGTTADQGQEPV